MRAATDRILRGIERYDFDLDGPLYDGQPIRAVDCGDVAADVAAPTAHVARAEEAVRRILAIAVNEVEVVVHVGGFPVRP